MEIERAIQIAEREWENIRVSLERYGDIGELDSQNHLNIFTSNGRLLIKNLISIDNKLPVYGYVTKEAAYVFGSLVLRAAERPGLKDKLAQAFSDGYIWARTGQNNPGRYFQDIRDL